MLNSNCDREILLRAILKAQSDPCTLARLCASEEDEGDLIKQVAAWLDCNSYAAEEVIRMPFRRLTPPHRRLIEDELRDI